MMVHQVATLAFFYTELSTMYVDGNVLHYNPIVLVNKIAEITPLNRSRAVTLTTIITLNSRTHPAIE